MKLSHRRLIDWTRVIILQEKNPGFLTRMIDFCIQVIMVFQKRKWIFSPVVGMVKIRNKTLCL